MDKTGFRIPMHSKISLRTAVRLALFAGTTTILSAQALAADVANDEPELAEVKVTATRREESVLDIPYSISAISGADLEQEHVQSLSDLTRMIAGVSFVDQGPTSRSNFVLRGINANSTDHPSTSTVAPVSTYIGETPLFLSLHIDDLERVEVLRGPQGTLYGSGSLAGTIRFIPKKPDISGFSASFEGDVADVTASDSYNRSFSGMVNIPVSDIAAFRLSAGYQHYAGFINENYVVKLGPANTANNSPVGIPVSGDPNNPMFGPMVFAPIRQANTADLWQTRAAFLIKPTDNFQALITFYHQDDQTHAIQAISPYFGGSVDTPAADNPYYSPAYPVSFPTGGVVFPHNGTYDTNDSFLLKNRRQADLGSVDLSFDLGFASLSSSSSYYKDAGTTIPTVRGTSRGFRSSTASFPGWWITRPTTMSRRASSRSSASSPRPASSSTTWRVFSTSISREPAARPSGFPGRRISARWPACRGQIRIPKATSITSSRTGRISSTVRCLES